MSTETGEIEMEGGSTSHGPEETHEIIIESASVVKKDSTSHALIDIQNLENILKNGTELSRSSPAVCIFEVPTCLKNIKRDVYVPEVVGLGPFHHHDTLPHLKEAKEEAVLRTLLKIYPHDPLAVGMEKLRNQVMGMKKEIENCYEMSFFFDPDMFILDSCFLLEFLFPAQQKFDYPRGYNWEGWGKASHSQITKDLMKLENQIPLTIIQRLIHLQSLSDDIMLDMAKRLLGDLTFSQTAVKPRHLLEYMSCDARGDVALPADTQTKYAPSGIDYIMWSLPSAHELEKAGIALKPGDKLSFERKWCGLKGVLNICPIGIDHGTEVKVKNMIAFEECLPPHHRFFTAAMCFFDRLIDKDADVEILKRANILENFIHSDQAIADLVNSCSVNVSFVPVEMTLMEMKAYYRSSWRLMIKEFMDIHVAKPWLLVGTLAAIALLGLTIMQTIYGVMSYQAGK